MFWYFLKLIFFQTGNPHFNEREKKERELTIIKNFLKTLLTLYEQIQLFKTQATIGCI